MARINARAKGASGERQLCDWLEKNFSLAEKPVRNLEQVRSGGGDIILSPFLFEVKRSETLDVQAAWVQCRTAADRAGLEPVLAHRKNRQPWHFYISARHIGCGLGYIQCTELVFKLWVGDSLSQQQRLHIA
jgi:Holliday junction resolvase